MRLLTVPGALALSFAATLALPAAARADPPAAPAAPATTVTEAKPAAPKMVCRTVEELGSRVRSHKVCQTAEWWKERGYRLGHDLEKVQQSLAMPGGG